MTAEVAILNKMAVALATDSAMTLGGSGKIYPTNKLFTLSKYHPVGIMIYNNAEFMGVPWEILIKMFREELGYNEKPTIQEYIDVLFEFLTQPHICNEHQRERNFVRIAYGLFEHVKSLALKEIQHAVDKNGRYSTRDLSRGLTIAIDFYLIHVEQEKECTSVDDLNASQLLKARRDALDGCVHQVFRGFHITKIFRRKLDRALSLSIKKNRFSSGASGIVVAGFGSDEMFPTIIELVTDGMIGENLKYDILRFENIDRDGTSASIMPFAQSEMVHRFMEGVDREFLEYLGISAEQLLYQFGCEVLEAHTTLSEVDKGRIFGGLRGAARTQIKAFEQEARKFRRKRFVTPITDIVAHLPKEELASMAESLVGLTSLKRRVSAEKETVGGPIDVNVISKGDGFIWIKRKHYFNLQLNSQFSHNYFHRTDHQEESQ